MAIEGHTNRYIAAELDMTRLGIKSAISRLAEAINVARGFTPEITLSYCYTCVTDKPTADFQFDRSRPNGFSPRCRSCQRAYDLARPDRKARRDRLEEHVIKRAATKYWRGRP